jgi:hypothetical protein
MVGGKTLINTPVRKKIGWFSRYVVYMGKKIYVYMFNVYQ